jgi:hypothetical protein
VTLLHKILALRKDCFGATPKPTRETRVLPQELRETALQVLRGFDDVLCVDAAFFHHFATRRT